MAQAGLYYRTQLETKVSLLPEQITAEIDNNLLENLKIKVEGKLIDVGIVLRINRIIDYDFGIIDRSNLQSTTIVPIKYECFICSPVKNLEIICVLENIIKGYLICRNGPIISAIYTNNINTSKFELRGSNIYYGKKQMLEKGDYLKVSIINIRNDQGEKNIMTLCKLIDMATDEEIESFKEDQLLITKGSKNDNKEFI